MKFNYVCYCEGGDKEGLGHLFRTTTLLSNLGYEDKTLYLFANLHQEKFYKERGLNNLNIKEFNWNLGGLIFFIDSKKNVSQILMKASPFFRKTMLIDNATKARKHASYIIEPSYYSRKTGSENVFSGYKYSILKKEFLTSKHKNKRSLVTLSFGGVDPNNITLKILRYLSKTSHLDDLLIVLGPGYKHKTSHLLDMVGNSKVYRNPKNLVDIFASSKVVITSVGVTLQELFRLGTPSVIITNHNKDERDIERILNCGEEFMGRYFNNFVSHYKNLNQKLLLSYLEDSFNYGFNPKIDLTEVGSGWNNLRKLIDQK